MSIGIRSVGGRGFAYRVECDQVGCSELGPAAYREVGGQNASRRKLVLFQLVESARRGGWSVLRTATDSHFCPQHRPVLYPL